MKLLDSLKMAWFSFARSRGWSASITLSDGSHIEGKSSTITIQSPLYKFTDDNTYKVIDVETEGEDVRKG